MKDTVIKNLGLKETQVQEVQIDLPLKDLLGKSETVKIVDMYGEVYTEHVTCIKKENNEILLVLPFATMGNHEWREDIADVLYR